MIRSFIAATVFSLAAAPAFAGSTDSFQMSIDVDRAGLETPEGAQQEFIKIREDIHERCTAESQDWNFATRYAVTFCESRTLKSAVNAIDDPNLTAVYKASVVR